MTTEVKVWIEKVVIPSYEVGQPDKNPMFFEKRVYQGSSGVVYPNPIIEKIYDEKVDKEYTAYFIENQYLKIMVLPQLGGRVQMAYDKIKQRHFVYYNQVIKPALVGLCGPWISGGIEFNWPQHHRPSTFEPVDCDIEENADGSKTIWVNEVEHMFRTKGMAGFTLHPGKAYLEIKAKLYNRTNLPQTFLWWANPAVKVNDDYQSVFPPDVNAVFDHGKRDVSTFPIATGTYYKVDYSPGTDISRYKNIPVPTSYMAINSDYDFVGGYEHDTQAGLLHVADHHVSPGKKQWTWGYSDFGVAWDRNLTDEDGPYIELMTGVFTDNQPDFSWLMPYEEKSFTQYFLPYRELGVVKNATKDILVNIEKHDGNFDLKIFVTSAQVGLHILLFVKKQLIFKEQADLKPEVVFVKQINYPDPTDDNDFWIVITNAEGKEVIRYEPLLNRRNEIPKRADAAPKPVDVENTEQLFLTGQHLEQYRHATYNPVLYYEEGLRRDPKDWRNNNALGLWYLRKGQFAKSEVYFTTAVKTLTQRNPNPYNSEAYYNLGLCYKYLDKTNAAYDAFFKSTWSAAWQEAGYFSVALIDMQRGNYQLALVHIDLAIDRNLSNHRAYVIKSAALRHMRKYAEAIETCRLSLKRDRFNLGALFELSICYSATNEEAAAKSKLKLLDDLSKKETYTLIEYAIDYADAGLYLEATELLKYALSNNVIDSPLVYYYMAWFFYRLNDTDLTLLYLEKAAHTKPDYCFPNRLEDILVLQLAIAMNPADGLAPYYLGNLWYDKRQYDLAVVQWQLAAKINPEFPTVWRNLAIACYNKLNDTAGALSCFEKAFRLNTTDARVLMELDQLYKRLNHRPEKRLEFLENNLTVAVSRDDVYLERASIYNFLGNYQKAFELISTHKFHPWEGGEGKVSGQYVLSLLEMAKAHIHNNNYAQAIDLLNKAQTYPHNLGEGKLYGAQENDVFYFLGCACHGIGDLEAATGYWKKAAKGLSEPSAAMFYNDQQPDKIFYQGLAMQKLNELVAARDIFERLVKYGELHMDDEVNIDYFAVSLPDLLIFEDDFRLRNNTHCRYIKGLGYLGSGQFDTAQKCFDNVLKNDAMHFGAKIHLNLLHNFKNLLST